MDSIEGLSPAISIEQKSTSHNPRSTVGTITEIYDYLRLLFARVGEPRCPEHDVPLTAQTISQMVDKVLSLPEESKMMLLAPVVKNRKGEHVKLLDSWRHKVIFAQELMVKSVIYLIRQNLLYRKNILLKWWWTALKCGQI